MRTPIALYAVALAVRALLVANHPDPAYPDSFYYVNVARALAAGQGFSIDFIWIFAEVGGRLPAEPMLPIPSNAHWLPLASLVQVPFIWLLGPTPFASAFPFALVGALAAPIAWAIARDAGARPAIQLGAGLLTAVPAASTVFMAQPDNFSLFQPLVAGALWLTARALKGEAGAFALAGLLAGFASLARNDGVLVAATIGLAFLWDRWRARRSAGTRRPVIPFATAVASGVLFIAVLGPWWLRQLAVFGQVSPTSANGRALWIRTIEEWNSITSDATFASFLGQGIGPLVESRVLGFVAAVSIFAILICALALAPFVLVGAWRRRRSVDFGPSFVYAALLFGSMSLLFAVHVPGGTFIHSAVALAPHAYVLALEGVAAAVAWVAARRRSWDEASATRVFLGAAVAFAMLAGAGAAVLVHAGYDRERDERQRLAAELDRIGVPPTDRLFGVDAGGLRYFTGRPAVVTPNDPLGTLETVARAYDLRWLVLERDGIVPPLEPLLVRDERPAWIGPPAWSLPATGPRAGDGIPEIALYPVCPAGGDPRCSGVAGGSAP